MRTSIVPASCAQSPPHVVVIGNQKGGSGKSTFAMHIIVALLKAGKRVASFDLDLNQLTLTRYLSNRREWDREHDLKLELPDHYPLTEEIPCDKAGSHSADLRQFISKLKKIGRAQKPDLDFIDDSASSHSVDLKQFTSQLKKIEQANKHDFIVIDTPGGVQHLSLIAHGMADTLITPLTTASSTSMYWSRLIKATSSLSHLHTPKPFSGHLTPDEVSAVARPTGLWFATAWN